MEDLLETHQPEKNGTVSKQGAVWKMFLVDKNIRIAPSWDSLWKTLRNHGVSYQWISLLQGQIHDKN